MSQCCRRATTRKNEDDRGDRTRDLWLLVFGLVGVTTSLVVRAIHRGSYIPGGDLIAATQGTCLPQHCPSGMCLAKPGIRIATTGSRSRPTVSPFPSSQAISDVCVRGLTGPTSAPWPLSSEDVADRNPAPRVGYLAHATLALHRRVSVGDRLRLTCVGPLCDNEPPTARSLAGDGMSSLSRDRKLLACLPAEPIGQCGVPGGTFPLPTRPHPDQTRLVVRGGRSNHRGSSDSSCAVVHKYYRISDNKWKIPSF